ncbi:MMPL family transporter [Streptomyces lichenis]|uniref:MMPL family transporter n=1 Tax=Streptomyces lichenis TaxID=2306967 RepID=A0ABT0IFB8_9ACTN|nr:MMPL family transporter [Streptomyces lichenis]MCK8680023.1 MMPL family transporter [Streptomyces lichenis]
MASWSALHPGRAIAGWFAFVVLCLVVGIAAGTHNAEAEDYRVGESGRADAIATSRGFQEKPTEQIMITARSGALDEAAARGAARALTDRMAKLPEVLDVADPVRSRDGRMLMVEVTMKGVKLEAKEHVDPLLAQTGAVREAHPDLLIEETGDASVSKGLNKQRGDDLAKSELITFPITLVTLLLVFGSLVMAAVPLLLAVSSIVGAVGLSMVASHLLPDAGVGTNVILLIGMAVGVDYTLFYLKREREERERADGRLSPEALVGIAAATSGRAIVVSGLAVVVSTATLYLATDVIFSSLATGTVIVVLVAVASSMTALPALLVKLGHRLDRRAAKTAARGKRPRGRDRRSTGRLWEALLRPARTRPGRTLLVAALVMLGLSLPALGMELRVLNKDTHSRQIPEMRTYDRLNDAFPELRAEHRVVVEADPASAVQTGAALRELTSRVRADRTFADRAPRVRTSRDGRVTVVEYAVPFRLSSTEATASLDHLRRTHLPATLGKVAGAAYAVDGPIAVDADYLDHQNRKLPLVVGFLLLLTFAMTVLVFRSVVIGLIGAALNLLSVAAAFGLVVVFFQWGLASTLFGFDPSATSAIGSRVPLFLFVILFGLSMDYQVFVLSRIKEAAMAGAPTREAVLDGIGASAKVVTSAAIVMVTVFSSFVFLHLAEMKQIGFSLAVAVLLDAFVIRVMILPSALVLLGDRTWWPSRPPRHPRPAPAPHLPAPEPSESSSGGRSR